MELLAVRVGASAIGFELRLDYLQDLTDLEARLHQMLARMHFPPVIATCRRVEAGGHFGGDTEQQAALLTAAIRAGCQWVDVEAESLNRAGIPWLRQFEAAKIIVSYHNYRHTPPLAPVHRRLARLPVDVIKIVARATHLRDNLRLHRLLRNHRRQKPALVAFALAD